jgi:ubiquinone/menaquinone biosynthesis C-methylase UbiE
MSHRVNQRVYTFWSPIYDLLFKPLSSRPRSKAIGYLELRVGQHLLIPGIGTGLDLPLLNPDINVTGLDFNRAMLAKAQQKVCRENITLFQGDAQRLPFPDESFDALLFNLLLSVVPDGAAAFCEGWRVLRTGGRAAIFDKFLPEDGQLTAGRQFIGLIIRTLGTDPNRKLSQVTAGVGGVRVILNEASLLRGQYRTILLEKIASSPTPQIA